MLGPITPVEVRLYAAVAVAAIATERIVSFRVALIPQELGSTGCASCRPRRETPRKQRVNPGLERGRSGDSRQRGIDLAEPFVPRRPLRARLRHLLLRPPDEVPPHDDRLRERHAA